VGLQKRQTLDIRVKPKDEAALVVFPPLLSQETIGSPEADHLTENQRRPTNFDFVPLLACLLSDPRPENVKNMMEFY
jgi:hypothetical protein